MAPGRPKMAPRSPITASDTAYEAGSPAKSNGRGFAHQPRRMARAFQKQFSRPPWSITTNKSTGDLQPKQLRTKMPLHQRARMDPPPPLISHQNQSPNSLTPTTHTRKTPKTHPISLSLRATAKWPQKVTPMALLASADCAKRLQCFRPQR